MFEYKEEGRCSQEGGRGPLDPSIETCKRKAEQQPSSITPFLDLGRHNKGFSEEPAVGFALEDSHKRAASSSMAIKLDGD